MKKMIYIGWLIFMMVMAVPCHAETDFILEFMPGSALMSPDAEGTIVERPLFSGDRLSEGIDGDTSFMPTLKLGVGFDLGSIYLDLTGGVGYLGNDALHSMMYMGDVALRFKFDEYGHVTLGPHVSIVSFDPEWEETSHLTLDGSIGYIAGLSFTAGSKKISFSGSVDYVSASFDAEPGAGWTLVEDSIEMSGVAVQLGIICRF